MIRSSLPLLACALLLANCSCTPKLRNIILSYSERNDNCLGCPNFRVDFTYGGHVDYECLRGCPVPGEQHYRVPPERFVELVRAFRDNRFFDVPRIDPNHVVFDVTIYRLTYRDDRRTHEVVDDYRQNTAISELEARFRTSTEADRYRRPSLAIYRDLVNKGWNVDWLGADQENALASAVLHRDLDSVRFLLQHGSKTTRGTFEFAAMSSNVELLRMIVESSLSELMGAHDLQVLTLMAVARSHTSMSLQYLLDLGLSPNLQDKGTGRTGLQSALESGDLENVKLLLDRGADPNLRDAAGRTVLSYSILEPPQFTALLIQHKADVNARDNQGQTALLRAAAACSPGNMEVLLKAGADPTLKDNRGQGVRYALLPNPRCKKAQELLENAAR